MELVQILVQFIFANEFLTINTLLSLHMYRTDYISAAVVRLCNTIYRMFGDEIVDYLLRV